MIRITQTADKVELASPYHPDLPAAAKSLGGKFDRQGKTWVFDARDYDRVRELARSIYGTDGTADTVSVRVDLSSSGYFNDGIIRDADLWSLGRLLVGRKYRDAAVRLGEGVILVQGKFADRGGSRNNPSIGPVDGIVLEVRDVPEPLATEAAEANPNMYTIVEESKVKVNPLAEYSTEKLLEELQRRGICVP